MHPAFSVVFLTTLIGVGQGLFLALYTGQLYSVAKLLPNTIPRSLARPAGNSASRIGNAFHGFGADTFDHCPYQSTRGKILPCSAFGIFGILFQ